MDNNQFILGQNGPSRKQLLELQLFPGRRGPRQDNNHRFSQPKARINIIKINKNKLPGDFFLKREPHSRRHIPNRHQLLSESPDSLRQYKKAESQRLHYSPDKTSFFGMLEEEQPPKLRAAGGSKLYSRKFETREESKRDAFPIQSARKLTTATKHPRNELLELFPATHDQRLSEIIVNSTQARNLKLSPRKELGSWAKELATVMDPEGGEGELQKQGGTLRLQDMAMSEHGVGLDSCNITFYNAKSTSFPPINRPGKQ